MKLFCGNKCCTYTICKINVQLGHPLCNEFRVMLASSAGPKEVCTHLLQCSMQVKELNRAMLAANAA